MSFVYIDDDTGEATSVNPDLVTHSLSGEITTYRVKTVTAQYYNSNTATAGPYIKLIIDEHYNFVRILSFKSADRTTVYGCVNRLIVPTGDNVSSAVGRLRDEEEEVPYIDLEDLHAPDNTTVTCTFVEVNTSGFVENYTLANEMGEGPAKLLLSPEDYGLQIDIDFAETGWIKNDGTIDSSQTSYVTSDFIPLYNVDRVYRTGNTSTNLIRYALYDAEFNLLQFFASAVPAPSSITELFGQPAALYQLRPDAEYIRISRRTNSSGLEFKYAILTKPDLHRRMTTLDGEGVSPHTFLNELGPRKYKLSIYSGDSYRITARELYEDGDDDSMKDRP